MLAHHHPWPAPAWPSGPKNCHAHPEIHRKPFPSTRRNHVGSRPRCSDRRCQLPTWRLHSHSVRPRSPRRPFARHPSRQKSRFVKGPGSSKVQVVVRRVWPALRCAVRVIPPSSTVSLSSRMRSTRPGSNQAQNGAHGSRHRERRPCRRTQPPAHRRPSLHIGRRSVA